MYFSNNSVGICDSSSFSIFSVIASLLITLCILLLSYLVPRTIFISFAIFSLVRHSKCRTSPVLKSSYIYSESISNNAIEIRKSLPRNFLNLGYSTANFSLFNTFLKKWILSICSADSEVLSKLLPVKYNNKSMDLQLPSYPVRFNSLEITRKISKLAKESLLNRW